MVDLERAFVNVADASLDPCRDCGENLVVAVLLLSVRCVPRAHRPTDPGATTSVLNTEALGEWVIGPDPDPLNVIADLFFFFFFSFSLLVFSYLH